MIAKLEIKSPAKMMRAAEKALSETPYSDLRKLRCEYNDGVLVLRGNLSTFYLKQVAQTVVARVEGVRNIDNRIEVGMAPGQVTTRRSCGSKLEAP